ncbi:MAG: hypothetical protein JSU65_07895 [Candidatus Zixiibacteriota bacterium]|nr:MAG: hypothetical protein JSU65_07895 [candidate division Zixibacteria bacterium]
MKTLFTRIILVIAAAMMLLSLLGSSCWEPKDRTNPLDPRSDYWDGRPLELAIEIVDTGALPYTHLTWRALEHHRVTGYHVFKDDIHTSTLTYIHIASTGIDQTWLIDTVENTSFAYWYFVSAILDNGLDSVVSDSVCNDRY